MHLRTRPGYFCAFSVFSGTMYYTFHEGPRLENKCFKYALAGTVATVFVEFMTHALDTINMKTKIINGPRIYVYQLIKKEGFGPLFRGVQAVFYGYLFSSLIYYYLYARLRQSFQQRCQDEPSFLQTIFAAFSSSAFAELIALFFYYPYDMIKTRMQTRNEHYKYANLVDAFLKINSEGKVTSILRRAPFFYRGMSFYGSAYILFVAIEFSLFETILRYMEQLQGAGVAAEGEHFHSRLNVIVAAFLAGSIGGFATNGLEFIAVNKQAHAISWKEMMKTKNIWRHMLFRGSLYRTVYYGLQSASMFLLLEEFAFMMHVNITEFD